MASGMAIRKGFIFERVVCCLWCGEPPTRKRCKVMYGEYDSTILERTRDFRGRSDHSGHGRRGPRQVDAGGKIRRRGRHASAPGDLSTDRDRRLPGRPKREE